MPEIENASNTTTTTSASTLPVREWFNQVADWLLFVFSQRETWIALTIVGLLILFVFLYKRFQVSRRNSLTTKIKTELSNTCKQEKIPVFFKEWLEQLYLPSWQSVTTVFGIGIVLFCLAHLERFKFISVNLSFQDSDHYQNLIAIHAGIGTIIFALLIFIAESLRDDETKDRARVLLRESFLFPLAVAEIVGFFIFIWGDVNIWATVPLVIVAFLTIASLWRLLLVLLSKARFSKKRLQLLKDRVKKSIDLAINERIGNAILLNSLGENKTELKYYPLSLDDENSTHHNFYADKTGVVTNVRLDKLDEFAKLVEKQSNKNGFSFYEEKAELQSTSPTENGSVSEGEIKKLSHCDRHYLGKKFKDNVEEDTLILLAVDKRCVTDDDTETLKRLSILAKEIFTIKKEENFSEEIKLEINGLTDQFISAIEAKKLGKIEELTRTYFGLADSFLESINACGGGYDYEQARKERGGFFGGWNEVRWLSDSVREILIKATQTHDREIIREVAYLPVHIATKAIKFGDQYVYQEFLTFPSLLYWLSEKEDQVDVKQFMIDRSWRHLKEMSDYYIEHQLKRKAQDVKTIEKYKDFTIPIFTAFQNLLKASFDKRKIDDYVEFLGKFGTLYEDLEEDFRYPRAEHMRFDLERATDPAVKKILEGRINVQEARESAAKDIKDKKSQVVFGLTAWILEQYRNHQDDEILQRFYNESINRLPNTLPELTALYISSRTFETEHFWDWDNWEIIPDAGVQSIDFHSKLDRLYCVKALKILANLSDDEIALIVLPHSRDLAFQADENPNNRSLFNTIDSITPEARWNFVLNDAAIAKTQDLKDLLKKARKAQEDAEEKFLETVEVDAEKLVEFNKKIKTSFAESTYLRPVIKKYGVYSDLTKEPCANRGKMWGYNQVDRKEAYIKDWYVHYSGWGENYGSGMAHSEDEIIFGEICNSIDQVKDIHQDAVLIEIETVIATQMFVNPLIIQTLDRMYEYTNVRRSELFVDQYHRDCPKTGLEGTPGYMGVLKMAGRNIPVVDIFARKADLKNRVVIIDLAKFGVLNQYSPIEKEENEKYKDDIFLIKVLDLNKDDDARNKIIADNPEWLQQYPDKETYLRRQVLINVYERFEFSLSDRKAAQMLIVNRSE